MKKNFTINFDFKKFFTRQLPIAGGVIIAGLVVGIFFIDTVVMPRIVGVNRDLVSVPSIKGLPWEGGRQKLFEVGLLNEIRSREYDEKLPEGSIVNQFPEPGVKVKKGRRIAVVLSKGKEIAMIPNIKDMTERQARIELKKRGLIVGKVKRIFNDTQAVDLIINTFPPQGTTVSREMEIDLMISKGAKPTSTEMPNIIGESLAQARKKVEDAGLVVGSINYQNNPSLLPGTVISQNVSPGTNISLESTVNIVVSVIKQ